MVENNQPLTSPEIRNKFLEFFKSHGHHIVPSAPIVVKNDPTLMFTNAGMNQFKAYFLGDEKPQYSRVADTQRCLRVSGKHNDLEEVGIDTYHHTMFEMLGNWSFGDYFKKEAIAWSWELLTDIYKLDKERLYVTVFKGDDQEGLPEDNETFNIWKTYVNESHILFGNKKDNFWEMGEVGPCGPCSEIHMDCRSDEERSKLDGKELVNQDHPQVIEIWNNVFMQFNRLANGTLATLPAKHVDTGMGFERLVRVIQQKESNYDTDLFQPLIQFIAKESGFIYGETEETDIAMRVIADHIRAIAFAIADGQLPSNNKAGYVIRRILRRAVRYSYTFLRFQDPFLYKLVPLLADQFEGVFNELGEQRDFIQKVILEEEQAFLKTLTVGIQRFDRYIADEGVISGKFAFELYDTFGFPIDLTELMGKEKGWKVDMAGFHQELKLQKERSRAATAQNTGDWIELLTDEKEQFVGYDSWESTAEIIKYRTVTVKNKRQYQLVLTKTPFYAESGGQVGDSGQLLSTNGFEEKIDILDTKKENGLLIHITEKLPSELDSTFKLKINYRRRKQIEANHTATHLLHAALRKILGEHVSQKGSFVNEHLLRFDFSHFSKVKNTEIEQIELLVNSKIREDIPLKEQRRMTIQAAKEAGATALFGEKYGDYVRVVTFDDCYSKELCGGTHVSSTGKIGFFKIIGESAVAAGVRRIEAITGETFGEYMLSQSRMISQLSEALKSPTDILTAVNNLLDENGQLKKRVDRFINEKILQLKYQFIDNADRWEDMTIIVEQVDLPSVEAIKKLAYSIKDSTQNLFLVLGSKIDNKPSLTVMISEELVKNRDLNAGSIVRELAKEIKGGGGGQPFFATAGGKEISGLSAALAKARIFLSTHNNV